jgi:phosphatidylserine decarboxylase
MFLSLFDVHANRSSCGGTVRSIEYTKGEFLDARHVESGSRNESNTLVIDPEDGMPGPIIIRQVAGKVARRICCHVGVGDRMEIGQRFGMIKFGSRTELIVPRLPGTEVLVAIGDKAHAGLTILARQTVETSKRQNVETRTSERRNGEESRPPEVGRAKCCGIEDERGTEAETPKP